MIEFCEITRSGTYGCLTIHAPTGDCVEIYTAEQEAKDVCEKITSAFRQHAAHVRADALKFALSTMRDQREKYRYLTDSISVFENVMKGEIEESELESVS
jgi:hypothetical protein